MELTELSLNRNLYKTQPQTLETQGAAVISSNLSPAPSTLISSGNTVIDINTNAMLINGANLEPGTFPVTTLDVSNWGWTQTCTFTVSDADTVAWGVGSFISASGISYSIGASNTGNMVAKTYIYFDITTPTIYHTTTTSSIAVGIGKVLVAVAQNGVSTATYNINVATQIVSDNILANSIDASKIVAGSITATQINSSYVYAGYINADRVTAGTLTGSTVQTSSGNDRVEMNSAGNEILFYNGGYILTYISNGTISFNTPLGVSSGGIYGYGAEHVAIDTGGELYNFSSTALYPDTGANLGGSSLKWGDAYIGGTSFLSGKLKIPVGTNLY